MARTLRCLQHSHLGIGLRLATVLFGLLLPRAGEAVGIPGSNFGVGECGGEREWGWGCGCACACGDGERAGHGELIGEDCGEGDMFSIWTGWGLYIVAVMTRWYADVPSRPGSNLTEELGWERGEDAEGGEDGVEIEKA